MVLISFCGFLCLLFDFGFALLFIWVGFGMVGRFCCFVILGLLFRIYYCVDCLCLDVLPSSLMALSCVIVNVCELFVVLLFNLVLVVL